MFGNIGYSGFITGSGGSTPSGSGSTQLPVKTAGVGDGPTVGLFTYTHPSLVGATALNFTIVNNIPEVLTVDFEFDSPGGEITRNNAWQPGDKLVVPYTPAS